MSKPMSPGRWIALQALIVVLAVPTVGYLWGVLHELLALRPAARQLLAIPAAGFLVVLLVLLARLLRTAAGEGSPSPGEDR